MTVKYCPHCQKEALDVTHHHGEELDVCRQCAGVWFEEGQLNAVISQVDNGEDNSDTNNCLGTN
jgi:Zn-finger nucleic acid-binding protein